MMPQLGLNEEVADILASPEAISPDMNLQNENNRRSEGGEEGGGKAFQGSCDACQQKVHAEN